VGSHLPTCWRRVPHRSWHPFTYEVPGNYLVVSRDGEEINHSLSKTNFRKAAEQIPVPGPAGLKGHRGSSYTWALLNDVRISAGAWWSIPQGGLPTDLLETRRCTAPVPGPLFELSSARPAGPSATQEACRQQPRGPHVDPQDVRRTSADGPSRPSSSTCRHSGRRSGTR
jgi:hypothetical protein